MQEWLVRNAKRLFLKSLEDFSEGFVEIVCPDRTHAFGDPKAPLRGLLEIHDERFFPRALFGGDIGIGESYMDGDWSSPDVVTVVRLALRNASLLDQRNRGFSAIRRWLDTLHLRFRSNTLSGSRSNIHAHYDLGNDFFRLFLDENFVYSSAFYRHADDSLEQAQTEKLDRVCRKLCLGPQDHVLEIGTGWGGFAIHAARNYGCRVTTTTISHEQRDYVAALLQRTANRGYPIQLLFEDYRELRGRYDKIISIEMFEAVGYKYYDDFFSVCDRLLTDEGSMLLQTITMHDQKFPTYRKKSDWTQKYIFPGAQLASLSGVLSSVARATSMSLFHAEDIGMHYARTLQEWRARFRANIPAVRAQGFEDRFIRMWDFYLASCAGSFLERYTSDVQLLLTKNFIRRSLFGEPWPNEDSFLLPLTVSIPEYVEDFNQS